MLPDSRLVIRGSDLFVDHPVLLILSERVNQAPRTTVNGEDYYAVWTSDNLTVYWHGPSASNRQVTGDQWWSLEHNNDGIGYARQGPHNAPRGNSTDNYAIQSAEACHFVEDSEAACREEYNETVLQPQRNLTPDVRFGVEIYDAEMATDPSLLEGKRGRESSVNDTPFRYNVTQRSQSEPVRTHEDTNISAALTPLSVELDPPRLDPEAPVDPELPPSEPLAPPLTPPDEPVPLAAVAAAAISIMILAALAAYSRFRHDPERLLSPPRRLIMELVKTKPQTEVAEVQKVLDVTRNGAIYHLRQLERAGMLKINREGPRRYVTARGAPAVSRGQPSVVKRHPRAHHLLETVAAAGSEGVTRSHLHSIHANVPKRTRNYLISKLIASGLLIETAETSGWRLRIRDVPSERESREVVTV